MYPNSSTVSFQKGGNHGTKNSNYLLQVNQVVSSGSRTRTPFSDLNRNEDLVLRRQNEKNLELIQN